MTPEQRLAMLEKMIEKGSTDPFHHYARAMELRGLGRPEEARTAYMKVRDRFPEYVPTYLMGAQLLVEIEDFEAAKEWIEAGIEKARAAGEGKAESELGELMNVVKQSGF